MEKKFNVGDKVTYLPDDMQGEITAVHSRGLYGVKYPDEDDSFTVNEADLEFADPKTAFLTRLQSLLREFDAEIRFLEGDKSPAIVFMGHKDEKTHFGEFIDGVVLYGKHCELSSDTIMDYDKE